MGATQCCWEVGGQDGGLTDQARDIKRRVRLTNETKLEPDGLGFSRTS